MGAGLAVWLLLASFRAAAIEQEALRIAEVAAREAQAAGVFVGNDVVDPHRAAPNRSLGRETTGLYTLRRISGWNISPRNALADDFERWAWNALRTQDRAAPNGPIRWQPVWRVEDEGGLRTLRYLKADPAISPECIACHSSAEARFDVIAMRSAMGQAPMPTRQVHQLLGATEVSVPLDAVAASGLAAWERLAGWLTGLLVLALALAGAVVQRVMQRSARERQALAHRASHDPLSGLPNRAVFRRQCDDLLARARQDKRSLALVCIDIDRLKDINDSLGLDYGDRVLRKIGSRLNRAMRPGEKAYRLSGDQFAAVLSDPGDLRALQKRIQKLLDRVTAPMRSGTLNHPLGASIGVSRFPQDAQTTDELVRKADHAMHRVKESGRNSVVLYEPQMDVQVKLGHALRDGLRHASSEGQFELYYQPVVHVASRRVVSVEALLRWRHPVHGLVPPNLFLSVAEDIGMLQHLDDWVLNAALSQRALWTEVGLPPFRIALNLTPPRYQESGLLAQIDKALVEHGVSPGLIALEVTEATLARNTRRVADTLIRCHRRGILIALDDLGTGYASLALLKMFPIDVIKVDKTFVDGLPDDSSDCTLASAIIGLSRSLGVSVVAEGVESLAQFDYLISLGCENMQGFLIARPMPANELEVLIRDDLFNLPVRGPVADQATSTYAGTPVVNDVIELGARPPPTLADALSGDTPSAIAALAAIAPVLASTGSEAVMAGGAAGDAAARDDAALNEAVRDNAILNDAILNDAVFNDAGGSEAIHDLPPAAASGFDAGLDDDFDGDVDVDVDVDADRGAVPLDFDVGAPRG